MFVVHPTGLEPTRLAVQDHKGDATLVKGLKLPEYIISGFLEKH